MSATATAENTIRRTTTEGLLTAAYALTHRIHEAAASYAPMPAGCTPGEVLSLRAQRDLISAEVLRRTGGK